MQQAIAPAPPRCLTPHPAPPALHAPRPGEQGRLHVGGVSLRAQLESALAALHPLAQRTLAVEIGCEADLLRRRSRERLRGTLLELRSAVERLAANAAASPAAIPPEALERLKTVEGHLHEAHWLARTTARRAEGIAKALDRAAAQGGEIREVAAALHEVAEESVARPLRRAI